MLRVAIVGVGKMGISHLAMVNAHPDVTVVGVCDSMTYVLDVLSKYTGVATFTNYRRMLDRVDADAVIIATPTSSHYELVSEALDRGIHVFCEKPLSLSSAQSEELATKAQAEGLVTQVGYHNRFVGTFREVKRLLDINAIGEVMHVTAEAYGPVVLKEKGSTWRSRRDSGGGCLYDYAAHPLDLLNWYFGSPTGVGGTVLGSVFSGETDDEVFSTLFFPGAMTGQLSVNWSDESYRKMTTQLTIFGKRGKIVADRQECKTYLRDTAQIPDGYRQGWNVRNTTELTEPVWFYLRGEEYSAELDYFITSALGCPILERAHRENNFGSAAATDRVIEMLIADAAAGPATRSETGNTVPSPEVRTPMWRRKPRVSVA
ncbi:MAG: Gfo/Idh/MocA family oxidoreductase [Mycetocola sp.]